MHIPKKNHFTRQQYQFFVDQTWRYHFYLATRSIEK
jgi:hypothetical protein